MPLHVDIKINERLINTLHIGRVSGDTNPDTVNSYVVVEGDDPKTMDEWLSGVEFTHRYGDGANVCVMKAIKALESDEQRLPY